MLIETLKENRFNIADACKQLDITITQFNSCRTDAKFREGLEEARQIADDFAREKFMGLIESGHANAIIKFQEWQSKQDNKNEALTIRKKTMKRLIELEVSKAAALREFSEIFDETSKVAERFYQIALTEYGLLSPTARKKKEQAEEKKKLSSLFKEGKLTEISTIQGLLEQALYDSQHSDYPSERAKASELVLKFMERLDEIEERERKKKEEDDSQLFDKLDAILAGTSPNEIARVREEICNDNHQIETKKGKNE